MDSLLHAIFIWLAITQAMTSAYMWDVRFAIGAAICGLAAMYFADVNW